MTDFHLDILVDSHDVDIMIDRLMASLTEVRLEAFLEERAVPYLHERIQRRFDNEGDDVSGPWLPLRFSTEKIREREGFGPKHPINQRTKAMIHYLTESSAAVALSGFPTVVIPGRGAAGEMLDKIATAQLGRAKPSTKPRPVLGMNAVDMEAIVGNLRMWITEELAA